MVVLRKQVMENFSRAAVGYDAYAQFQHGETARVLDAALMLLPEKARVLDIGCGTGYFTQIAAQARPDWDMLGVDLAFGMCAASAKLHKAIQADAVALPLADASVDAVVSSLCLQWVEKLDVAFAEITRVLKPGGRAIIASLGAESLYELRQAAKDAELPLTLLPMSNAARYHAAIAANGLNATLFKQDAHVDHFATVSELMESMRRIGAGNNLEAPARGMTGPRRWKSMLAHYEIQRTPRGLPASWDRLFMILHKPL